MEIKEWVKLKAECGAPVWVNYDASKKGMAADAIVPRGSCDDNWPGQAGLAHAMEHMTFQGTERFKGQKELSEQIEEYGGKLNAATSREMTFFYSVLPIEFAERGFIHLNEMLLHSLFRPENIKTEMSNIVQEIKRAKNNPVRVAADIFLDAVYKGHPFAKPTLGTEEAVTSFRQKDFLECMNNFYYPENLIFVVAGGLEPEKAKALVDKFFPASSPARKPTNRIIPASLVGNTPRFLFVPRNDWEQANIFIGTTVTEGNSAEMRAINFYVKMIDGGSMSGPLFQEVRNKRGLAYEIEAEADFFRLLSLVSIYVGTDSSKHQEATDVIIKVIRENKNSRELFEKTKVKLLGANALYFDSMSPVSMIDSATENIIIRDQPIVFEDRKKEIEAITLEEVEAVVDKYFSPDRITTVVVGPEPKK